MMTILNNAHLQRLIRERPWTLPRPEFGWCELMLADDSQTRYWKEYFRMRKETFLRKRKKSRRSTACMHLLMRKNIGKIKLSNSACPNWSTV